MALLDVHNIVVEYPVARAASRGRTVVRAVDGVSFKIADHSTLGLVGESGCGKTSLSRALLGLVQPVHGTVRLDGRDLHALNGAELRRARRQMQAIFQNPYQTLNPRMRIEEMLAEPLIAHGIMSKRDARDEARELVQLVGLDASSLNRYPHEFSGGQRQRLSIARALAMKPKLLICDEPTSALDVSVRAQILNLLADLREQIGLSYLLITHDLSIASNVCDYVAVMYLGRIVEIGPTPAIFANPLHPYTKALISAAPVPDPMAERARERVRLSGDVPSPLNRPTGCAFRSRCIPFGDLGEPIPCKVDPPRLLSFDWSKGSIDDSEQTHMVACHLFQSPDDMTRDNAGASSPSVVDYVTWRPH